MNQDSLSRLVDKLGGLGYGDNDGIDGLSLNYRQFSRQELDHLYRSFWAIRKVCDYKPNMMSREWGGISLGSARTRASQLIDNVNNKFKKAKGLYNLAQKLANKDGGACIIRLVDDGQDYSDPINESSIRTFNYSRVYSRWDIAPYSQIHEEDPLNPKLYQFTTVKGERKLIHNSRVVRFRGSFVSYEDLQVNSGWETSLIVPFLEPCLRYSQGMGYVGASIKTFEVMIHLIEDLFTATESPDATERLLKRMRLNQVQMSALRGIVADKEREDIKMVARQYTGVSDIIEKLKDEMVAASGLTKPQLLSEHPTGLSATGESERLAEADGIRADQIRFWDDLIHEDCRLYLLSKECPSRGKIPKSWNWEWKSLFQLPPNEEANLRKTYADIDSTNIGNGIYSAEEARTSRYGSNTFNKEITLSAGMPESESKTESNVEDEPVITNKKKLKTEEK